MEQKDTLISDKIYDSKQILAARKSMRVVQIKKIIGQISIFLVGLLIAVLAGIGVNQVFNTSDIGSVIAVIIFTGFIFYAPQAFKWLD